MTAAVLPDAATVFGRRVRARLTNEEIIWMVTVDANGRPQPNPVGFCVDGDPEDAEFIIYSRPDAHRLGHIRRAPDHVAFHFDSDGHGQDIVVLHGHVVVDDEHPALANWPPYLAKYGTAVERAFGSIAEFSDSYSVALRVTITSVRGMYQPGQG